MRCGCVYFFNLLKNQYCTNNNGLAFILKGVRSKWASAIIAVVHVRPLLGDLQLDVAGAIMPVYRYNYDNTTTGNVDTPGNNEWAHNDALSGLHIINVLLYLYAYFVHQTLCLTTCKNRLIETILTSGQT